jgi:hypothetical protein
MKVKVEQTDMVSTGGKPLKNIGYVTWTEKHDQTADEVQQEQQKEDQEETETDGNLGTAMKIIGDALQGGKRLQRDVHGLLDKWEDDNKSTISPETRSRARRKIGAVGSQGKPWFWWLPGKEYEEGSREKTIQDHEVL